jgi:hypothetical protein
MPTMQAHSSCRYSFRTGSGIGGGGEIVAGADAGRKRSSPWRVLNQGLVVIPVQA